MDENRSSDVRRVGGHVLVHGVGLGVLVGGLDLESLIFEIDLFTDSSSVYQDLPLGLAMMLIIAMPVVWCSMLYLVQGVFQSLFERGMSGSRAMIWRVASVLAVLTWGVLWHDTVMQGDGIRSHASFSLIYGGSLVAMEAALVALTLLGHRMTRPRSLCHLVAGLALWGFSLTMLPLYTEFHFFSVIYGAWVAGKALWFLREEPSRRAVLIAAGIWASMVGALIYASVAHATYFKVLRYDLRLSKVVVMHGPGRFVPPRNDFEPLTPDIRARAMQRVDARRVDGTAHVAQGRPTAKHVVVIVLESMRAQSWSDPELAPEFASWKSRGTYFPHAMAQYPATPLAYGAMSLSQTPYVLIHSPYWAKRTLIDHLYEKGAFSEVFLSLPNNPWFEQTAITNFILNPDRPRAVHESTAQGLEALRHRLLDASGEDDRLFGWVHVYDAHAPYTLHEDLREPKPGEHEQVSAYLSEVRHVDAELGRFMTWFYAQPVAEETLLVVIGDHGEGLGDRVFRRIFWGHHAQVHRSVAHIPLYMSGPGVAQGRVIEASVAGQIDVMPTLFSGMGEPLPEEFQVQGRSLFDVAGAHTPAQSSYPAQRYSVEAFSLRGQEFFDFVAKTTTRGGRVSPDRQLAEVVAPGQGYNPKVAIVKGDYKLIYNRVTHLHTLYDVSKDPEESDDLSRTHPNQLAAMIQELELWRQEQQLIIERFNTFSE